MDELFARVIVAVGRMLPSGVQLLGTAFAVGENIFATAAHITDQNDTGLVLVVPKISNLSDFQDTTDQSINTIPIKIRDYDPIHDVAILETHDAKAVFSYTLGGVDEAVSGAEIISAGFPHADFGRLVLTQQASSVGARILMKAGPVKAKHLVMNVQTRPGTSGSPSSYAGRIVSWPWSSAATRPRSKAASGSGTSIPIRCIKRPTRCPLNTLRACYDNNARIFGRSSDWMGGIPASVPTDGHCRASGKWSRRRGCR